jgi:hypothetical protein
MKNSCFPDLSVGVLVPGLSLSSMTPHRAHTTPSSPTVPSPSRSEKLLRDALLRDERERRHMRSSSPPPLSEAPSYARRHTTSSYSASSKENYTCGSPVLPAMNVPSPYKTGTAPNVTPSRIPVRVQTHTHRKKEGGLELRMPTRDRHSLGSAESFSSGTSGSSVSHFHIGCASEYGASQSSLDAVSVPPQTPQTPPHFSVGHHLVQQSAPNSPSPSTKHFNARKASTQCRAIEGYVSFASVEGLGEPPLVREEFDADGGGKDERMGVAFLPLGVLNAALRWKKFVGGTGPGISLGLEGKDQGVVV